MRCIDDTRLGRKGLSGEIDVALKSSSSRRGSRASRLNRDAEQTREIGGRELFDDE